MAEFIASIYDDAPLMPVDIITRIVLAVILGGIIGLERGMRNHPAGLRTHILLCLGACLAMLINEFAFDQVGMSGMDPTRLGANVISGIGFLGVGSIFMSGKHTLRGITTAAGLWAAGIIGLACGIGFYFAAILTTFCIVVVVALFPYIEAFFFRYMRQIRLHIETATLDEEKRALACIEAAGNEIRQKTLSSVSARDARVSAYYTINLRPGIDADTFVEEVARLPGVDVVEVL
ncbi:MAG: MgtC/SapB family protein [Clostridiales Family XIII bacterium]|jgi:putative Mg2+ transporter-C (MgtC) family protein|nr:MgtC/SapB family protein [Clostridiales Family XIII bacterium]